MPLKRVIIGRAIFEGDADKELFEKYLVGTVTAMADMDGVPLPYDIIEKLSHLIPRVD
jgi:hypothetical protein